MQCTRDKMAWIFCKNDNGREYKLFWVGRNSGLGGVGIFVAGKWVQHVLDVNRINDRPITVRLLVDNATPHNKG